MAVVAALGLVASSHSTSYSIHNMPADWFDALSRNIAAADNTSYSCSLDRHSQRIAGSNC